MLGEGLRGVDCGTSNNPTKGYERNTENESRYHRGDTEMCHLAETAGRFILTVSM